MSTHTPCQRCTIETRIIKASEKARQGTSDSYYRVIVFCPLHAAAPELLAACVALVNAAPNALHDGLAAIARAEGTP